MPPLSRGTLSLPSSASIPPLLREVILPQGEQNGLAVGFDCDYLHIPDGVSIAASRRAFSSLD